MQKHPLTIKFPITAMNVSNRLINQENISLYLDFDLHPQVMLEATGGGSM